MPWRPTGRAVKLGVQTTRSTCPPPLQANGHDTRRDTVLQSSAATLPKSSATTAVRTEIASQRSSLLQTSGCRGRLMAENNHTGTASCSGAARRAAEAWARTPGGGWVHAHIRAHVHIHVEGGIGPGRQEEDADESVARVIVRNSYMNV